MMSPAGEPCSVPANLLNLPCYKVLGIQPEHIGVEHRQGLADIAGALGCTEFNSHPHDRKRRVVNPFQLWKPEGKKFNLWILIFANQYVTE